MRLAPSLALLIGLASPLAPFRAEARETDAAVLSVSDPADQGRRLPGEPKAYPAPANAQVNPGAVETPPPQAFPQDQLPIPDRWRLVEDLGVHSRWFDPYNQNTFKGDRPIWGTQNWFLVLNGVSDSVLEPRSFPTPVGDQTTQRAGSLDPFGRANSFLASQTILAGAALIEGSTAFKPPEFEARLSLAFNYNHVDVSERGILSVETSKPPHRDDYFVGVQEAFIDYHLRNVSARYDFDSVRVGIQPFSTDFRGFLFQDNQLGVRLFGNRDDNRIQYNLAFFARLEKNSNSGLNSLVQPIRNDQIFVANLYRQDLPVPGITSQLTAVYNRNREGDGIHYDDNGFPVRPELIGNDKPRNYDVVYLGYNTDGHVGRINLTASAYGAFGQDRNNVLTGRPADIRSWFVAAEPSYDINWLRIRLSGLYASGDHSPRGGVETGFDAILENPQFAGADTSYWIRQSIPFVGGGQGVSLNGRNGVLVSLRSSKDEGQSNFNNPGTVLAGVGADADLTPTIRLSGNLNHLWMADSTVVEALRQQGGINATLGWDYSLALIWRPKMTQNIVFRASAAIFNPDNGFNQLFSSSSGDIKYYSVLFNVVFSY